MSINLANHKSFRLQARHVFFNKSSVLSELPFLIHFAGRFDGNAIPSTTICRNGAG